MLLSADDGGSASAETAILGLIPSVPKRVTSVDALQVDTVLNVLRKDPKTKRFKRTLRFDTDTQYANSRENPLCQATNDT